MVSGETGLYNSCVPVLRLVALAALLTASASGQQSISFSTEDGGRVCADLYGQGARAVVLAHGGRFNKESWRVQANALVSEGFRVSRNRLSRIRMLDRSGPGRF